MIDNYFPFSTFRQNQREILHEARDAFNSGIEVVIIEGPTGFGKSPVNIALGRSFAPSFYTTPQVQLVKQIAKDFGPEELAINGGYGNIVALLGRKNYICNATNKRSDRCPIRDDYETPCSQVANCTYSIQKEATMKARVAVITFAMLILNSFVRGYNRFSKRNLLIVDECHNLENQVASMFAGVGISPYILPKRLQNKYWYRIIKQFPQSRKVEDYIQAFTDLKEKLYHDIYYDLERAHERDKIEDFLRRLEYMLDELHDGRTWVIQNSKVKFNGSWERKIILKPIYVDRFLRRTIFAHAKKHIILSTATVPFRKDPQKWLYRLGLGDKSFKLFSVPMTFPLRNRPIIFLENGGKMTNSLEDKNWAKNLGYIKAILRSHKGEKGVIHTQSYERAKRLAKDLNSEIFLHDKQKVDGDVIQAWIKSKKQVLLSPAIKEGVDLRGEMCRFQILLKVPYPHAGDKRVKFLLEEKKAWNWYFNEASRDITQIYGRAIRSKEDYATLYIIDKSFGDVLRRASFPGYFLDAIQNKKEV